MIIGFNLLSVIAVLVASCCCPFPSNTVQATVQMTQIPDIPMVTSVAVMAMPTAANPEPSLQVIQTTEKSEALQI